MTESTRKPPDLFGKAPDFDQLDKDFTSLTHLLNQMPPSHIWVLLCTCIVQYCLANKMHLFTLIAAIRDLWGMLEAGEERETGGSEAAEDSPTVH